MTRLAPLLLLLACAEEADPRCSREPPLTWENFGHGFTMQFCAGCHSSLIPPSQREGAPEDYNFDTYEGVVYWADKMERPVVDGEMPPGGGPTAAEIALFAEWLACEVMPDNDRYWFGP